MTKNQKLKVFNKVNKNTLMDFMDIEYIDIGDDFLLAKMPVTKKVFQPEKLLHGGASVALAESVGSAASHMYINTCLLYTSPSPRDKRQSRMPSSA